MDVTEITAVRRRPIARVRRRLAQPAAAPSLRAQLVLMLSIFLLGCVLSALVFVGIWRHTATDANRSRANAVAIGRSLHATRERLATVQAQVASARSAAAGARSARLLAERDLVRLRRLNSSAASSLAPRIHAISNDVAELGQAAAKLDSALGTLNDYLRRASRTGLDPAFVAAQIHYLAQTTAAMRASALAATDQAKKAAATAVSLQTKG